MCTGGRNPPSNLVMREPMGGDFFKGVGGLALISSLCGGGGGLKLIFA